MAKSLNSNYLSSMKTKPYTPRPSADTGPVDSGFTVDFPCMMTGGGAPLAGPLPLSLCMLQGLYLVRLDSKFRIESTDGAHLLELANGKVSGDASLVQLFLAQNKMLLKMFDDMHQEANDIVTNMQRA